MTVNDTHGVDRRDPIWLLNEYRAAEIHGAGAIMRMGRLVDSTELAADLSRHLRDEAVHAWLWTKAITEMGGEIIDVDKPYQTRLGSYFGLPRTLTDFLALTWASERRGVTEYNEHLDAADVTAPIKRTLRAILRDETWHVRYIGEELQRRVRADRHVQDTIDRAMAADARAIADLAVGAATTAERDGRDSPH
jgi:hypothetical protein